MGFLLFYAPQPAPKDALDAVVNTLQRYPGNAPVRLRFSEGHLDYYLDLPDYKVAWEHKLAKELDAWSDGENNAAEGATAGI